MRSTVVLSVALSFCFVTLDTFADTQIRVEKFEGLHGQIVFSADIPSQGFKLRILDLDKKTVRALDVGDGNLGYPVWSPSGHELAFTSDETGSTQVYVAHSDGTNRRQISKGPEKHDTPAFSPDGKSLVYYKERGSDAVLVTSPIDSPHASVMAPIKGRNTTPDWSPDANTIIYSTNRFWPGWDLCIWNIPNKNENCITRGVSSHCRARFSHDGKSIAYSSGVLKDIDLVVRNLTTGKDKTVTGLPGREYDVDWSPDDTRLVFTAENGNKELFSLYVTDLDGNVTKLLDTSVSLRFVSWTQATALSQAAKLAKDQMDDAQ